MADNKESPKEKRSIDSTVLAAIIGGIVTITVTAITVFANRPPAVTPVPVQITVPVVITATNVPVFPTETVPAVNPTLTPVPASDTPVPTFTVTSAPILAPGEDWKANCISSLWVLYPVAEIPVENNCLKTPVDQFFTKDGKFAFGFSVNVPTAEQHGLFVKLPSDGSFTLNLRLNEVTNGEILVGVFAEPDFNKSGALMVIPASNNPNKTKIQLKSMPGQKLFSQSSGPVDSNSGIYDLFFNFNSGEVTVKVKSGQFNLGTMPVLSSDKWLFIGYQVFIGSNRLNAEFSDLVIVQK